MAIPYPALQFQVTPPGTDVPVDLTQYLTYSGAQQSMTITQNFGRQGDTAVFPLVVEHPAGSLPWHILPMSLVKLHDPIAGQTLFGGVVTNPAYAPQGPALMEIDLNCVDYTFYADHALTRWPSSSVQASDRLVVAVTQAANNGAGCGISAARIADGGFIAPGPDLPEWTTGYATLSSVWRTLASQMGQVIPYGWYVDDSRNLHFYNQDTALHSGVTFTTRPVTGGSITEGHILDDSQFLYEHDATALSNQVLVQGASQRITYSLSGPPTDRWPTDGISTSWPLRYTVSASSSAATLAAAEKSTASSSQPVVLYVGGVYAKVTVLGSGQVPGPGWSIISNSSGGWFLVSSTPPGAGSDIEVWYTYEVPVIAQATDRASVNRYRGPNSGVFAKFISDSSLTSVPMALARGQVDRLEYAFEVEKVTFNTSPEFMGWVRAGYVFTLDCQIVPDSQRGYAMGVNDTFLCVANTVTFSDGGYRTCQITAVRT